MTRNGENYDNVQYVLSNSSNNVIKKVLNSQFNTKIKTIDFNFGYNLMLRDQPDYRVNPITKSLYTEDRYTTAWRDTYRFWSVLNENSFNGGINKDFGQIKIGAGYIKRIRDFKARIFRYTSSDMLDEITNNSDRYKANFDLISSYAMYDKELGDWKINAGLRTEYNKFNVNTADFSGQRVSVNRNYLDFLPSINISKTAGKIKKRVSISKTLARPEFREVANFAYYDFVRNAQLLGNSKLEKSDIYNVDLKWEYYPNSGENISVSAFGKQFIKPIEQIVADGSVPSNLLLTYTNPDKAFLYGIELEVRKKLLDWLDFYANASIMTCEVNANGIKRPLQGQSNYMVNSGINVKKNNNALSLVYNRVGDRISAVGFQGYSNIFENSRDIIDITFLRKFKKVDIKLSVSDLLSQPSIYYQKPQRNLIKTNNEKTISLTVNVNL
jgi:outer membrane receptor protein involved in Fe transport